MVDSQKQNLLCTMGKFKISVVAVSTGILRELLECVGFD
jgi:hypothetical protein